MKHIAGHEQRRGGARAEICVLGGNGVSRAVVGNMDDGGSGMRPAGSFRVRGCPRL